MMWLQSVLGQSVTGGDGLPDTIANWSLVGVLASLLAFFLRRQGKLQDNAQIAAQEAEKRVSDAYEIRLREQRDDLIARLQAAEQDRRETERVLIDQVARQTTALRRVVSALSVESSSFDHEARIQLRDDVLRVLFSSGHDSGEHPTVGGPPTP